MKPFIQLVGLLSIVAGVLLLLMGFREDSSYISLGVECILGSILIFGFAVVVDAASVYIEKNRKAEE